MVLLKVERASSQLNGSNFSPFKPIRNRRICFIWSCIEKPTIILAHEKFSFSREFFHLRIFSKHWIRSVRMEQRVNKLFSLIMVFFHILVESRPKIYEFDVLKHFRFLSQNMPFVWLLSNIRCPVSYVRR